MLFLKTTQIQDDQEEKFLGTKLACDSNEGVARSRKIHEVLTNTRDFVDMWTRAYSVQDYVNWIRCGFMRYCRCKESFWLPFQRGRSIVRTIWDHDWYVCSFLSQEKIFKAILLNKSFAHLSQCKKKLIMYFNHVVVFSIVSYRSLNFQYQEVLRYVWDSRLISSPNVLFLVNLMISDLSPPVSYLGNGVSRVLIGYLHVIWVTNFLAFWLVHLILVISSYAI